MHIRSHVCSVVILSLMQDEAFQMFACGPVQIHTSCSEGSSSIQCRHSDRQNSCHEKKLTLNTRSYLLAVSLTMLLGVSRPEVLGQLGWRPRASMERHHVEGLRTPTAVTNWGDAMRRASAWPQGVAKSLRGSRSCSRDWQGIRSWQGNGQGILRSV